MDRAPQVNQVGLEANGTTLQFQAVEILFNDSRNAHSVFASKNNKSLQETIQHRRYVHLREDTESRYPDRLDEPLGEFLLELKQSGDDFYSRFLNKHGDLEYCGFKLADEPNLECKGLYLFLHDGAVKYIGRCRDSFRKRFNSGYGKIAPKNCYIDGQSTNCRLNALVAMHRVGLSINLCPLSADAEISALEATLIREMNPPWNLSVPWQKE